MAMRDDLNNLSVGLGGSLFTNSSILTLATSMSWAEPVASNISGETKKDGTPARTSNFNSVVLFIHSRNQDRGICVVL